MRQSQRLRRSYVKKPLTMTAGHVVIKGRGTRPRAVQRHVGVVPDVRQRNVNTGETDPIAELPIGSTQERS